MKGHIRNGVNAGLTFAVVTIFFSLIGFTSTATELLGGFIGNTSTARASSPGAIFNLVFLLTLVYLWNGSMAAKPTEEDTQSKAMQSGLVAGVVAGLLVAIYAFTIGSINAAGIDMRDYLTSMSSDAIELFLLGLSPVLGAVVQLLWISAAGLGGGWLAFRLRDKPLRKAIGRLWERIKERFAQVPLIQKINQSKYGNFIWYGVILLVLVLIPLPLSDYWNYTLGTIGIYVLLGLGLNIVVGMAGLLDLGYVAFFAIGAYSVALLTAPTPHNLLWNFWIALMVGVVLAALAGILLGIPVLRMRGDYLAIVTLGFGEIIRILSKSDALTGFSGGPRGVRDIAGPSILGMPFNSPRDFVWLIILGCLLVIFVTSRLQNSRVGRAWVAMREDETVAQAMGINTWQYKLMAFAIGAAFAGLGGVLFASRNMFTGPEDHNLMVSINVLSLVIVGGMGSIPGVITGSLVLKGLPELLRQLETYRMLAFGALLVAMMIFRPEGLWPSQRRRLEMHGEEEPLPQEHLADPSGGDAA